MRRSAATILVAAAVYGWSIGWIHGARMAAWNLGKFPLLIFATTLICAPTYYAFTLLVTRKLTFVEVAALSLGTFADLSLLLASLAPVSFFLAKTAVRPTAESLGEYPFFLGLNVVFIAVCGCLALARRTLRLARDHGLALSRAATILGAWLAASLFVGGQCAWYMRPFFAVATNPNPAFMEGTAPDFRGATSFYEAVWQIVEPPK